MVAVGQSVTHNMCEDPLCRSLERSNIVMLLRSSGVVKRVKNPLRNVCENANSLSHKAVHLWSWHICKGVDVSMLVMA